MGDEGEVVVELEAPELEEARAEILLGPVVGKRAGVVRYLAIEAGRELGFGQAVQVGGPCGGGHDDVGRIVGGQRWQRRW